MHEQDNNGYHHLGYIDDAEVGVLHSLRGQSILVRQSDVGRHLAGLLGIARPEIVERGGLAFLCIPHDDQVDRLLRQVVDVLISIRYAHPTLVQLQMELEREPVSAKGDRP